MEIVKKIIIFGIIVAVIYFLMGYHFILNGITNVKPLKKSAYTLKYTIYNVKGKKPEKILRIKELRDDGIGKILVEMGLISEDRLEIMLEMIKEEEGGH